MPISKVVYAGRSLIDLTKDTVDAEHLAEGYTAHDSKGNLITGLLAAAAGEVKIPGIAAIATGTHTLSADVRGGSSFNVVHNLGRIPDLFVIWAPKNVAQTYSMLFAARSEQFTWRGSTYPNLCYYHANSTTTVTGTTASSSYGISSMSSSTQATVKTYSNSTSYYWRAGTYNWLAIKFE